jgi:hypothetical protein
VVANQKTVKAMIAKTIADMEATWGIEKHERYWREIMAYMLVGMEIANNLKVASFDLVRLNQWMKQWYVDYKQRVQELLSTARDVLVIIVAKYVRDTVFVMPNGIRTMPTGGNGQLFYDHITQELWVSAHVLQREAMAMGVDITAITTDMRSPTFTYLNEQVMAPARDLVSGLSVSASTNGHRYKVTNVAQLPVAYNHSSASSMADTTTRS